MAVTFVPTIAKAAEIFFAPETTKCTFTEVGAVQVSHRGMTVNRGHAPIDGSANTGRCQVILNDYRIPGPRKPSIQATFPFRFDNMEIMFNFLFGEVFGATTALTWEIQDNPTTYSVGVNDGVKYWKFAGCYMTAATIRLTEEAVGEIAVTIEASALDDLAAAGTFPALTPDHDRSPYVLTDMAFSHKSSAPVDTAAIKVSDTELTFTRPVFWKHYNSFDRVGAPGAFRLESARFAYPISTEFYTEFGSLVATGTGGYTDEYVNIVCTSSTGSKAITFNDMPMRLSMPDGVNIPLEGINGTNLVGAGGMDDGAGTTETVTVTASAF